MRIARLQVIFAALSCAALHAADLKATLENANLRLRRNSPIPIEVRFENPTPRLIEGRLELTLLAGDHRSGVHRSGELVLQPGTRVVPLLIPPPAGVQEGDGVAARLRWLGADGNRDLGEHRIGIYGIAGYELVLAIARTDRRLSNVDHHREAGLKLESLRPKLDAAGWLAFTTHLGTLPVENLPLHPLGWCAYDAVFLDGPAFAAAGERQLAALARWVEAGGSAGVCVDAKLGERHVEFLNRLGASEQPAVTFAADASGGLIGSGAGIKLLRPGLGRAFVAFYPGSAPADFDRLEWRAAVAWLWKLRESEQREVARSGTWSKDFLRSSAGWRSPDDMELDAIWNAVSGFNALKPGAPKRMPLGIVALVLGLLLVTVGPADWLAFGWLRRRRWTWIAFPIACVLFAWWTMRLAARHLGVKDRTGSVRLVDLGEDGRVLREVRFEMLLPSRDREWTLDVRDGLAVPVPRSGPVQFGRSRSSLARQGLPFGTGAPGAGLAALTEWPSPGHFTLRRSLRQWTPAMVRVTSFANEIEGGRADWDAALAHFRSDMVTQSWTPDGDGNHAFRFEIPRRDGAEERYARQIPGLLVEDGNAVSRDDDQAFARWIMFGSNSRILGGLGTTASPHLAGCSDLLHMDGKPWNRRVVGAWRRAGTELLIYRRRFPVK